MIPLHFFTCRIFKPVCVCVKARAYFEVDVDLALLGDGEDGTADRRGLAELQSAAVRECRDRQREPRQ